jgi:hypothetical protein
MGILSGEVLSRCSGSLGVILGKKMRTFVLYRFFAENRFGILYLWLVPHDANNDAFRAVFLLQSFQQVPNILFPQLDQIANFHKILINLSIPNLYLVDLNLGTGRADIFLIILKNASDLFGEVSELSLRHEFQERRLRLGWLHDLE